MVDDKVGMGDRSSADAKKEALKRKTLADAKREISERKTVISEVFAKWWAGGISADDMSDYYQSKAVICQRLKAVLDFRGEAAQKAYGAAYSDRFSE
jgi:hypothetical protein